MRIPPGPAAAQEGTSNSPGTSGETAPGCDIDAARSALVRSLLGRIGDKWSVIVICKLGSQPRRFNELRRLCDGITQRMLSSTLRNLERDGIVSRTVFPTVPPGVEYALTDTGRSLLEIVQALASWVDANLDTICDARANYDQRTNHPTHP
ncbi:helix-turn-helix transcriptional regulator [Saccharopolyspora sp. K220]|uniref:winged helix-turn-helix transcriptional regulator n=1 Tax=Saccharopolyspora soli TaxID=2926618 RepID=UPI001F5649F0|nr:helix-turn-helix domain-containing protein [Saccharopolyspora soli]MCI2416932.1 helix-turn-helix transcriptional regulator [Saccharopolyspora soli]